MKPKKPLASFTAFAGRHVAPPPEPPAAQVKPTRSGADVVKRPLRLKPATSRMLAELAADRPGLSLNELISVLIIEDWAQVFDPRVGVTSPSITSTISAAVAAAVAAKGAPDSAVPAIVEAAVAATMDSFRHHSDASRVPNGGKASSRTLRLRPDVDQKLGELAAHYGGLDRNSAVSLVLTSSWRRSQPSGPR